MRHGRALVSCAVGALALTACAGPEAMLDPNGPAARITADVWWFMFWLGTAVYVVVMVLAVIAFVRARGAARAGRDGYAEEDARRIGRRLVVYGGLVGPALVLLVLYVVTVPTSMAVADRGPTAGTGDEVVVNVVAEKFWWRVTYPDLDVETANEIHIPAGEPVRIRLTSTDVIHSFWVPRLAGKIDATPGHTTELIIEAEEPGRYRGRCTEYCGLAHAQMIVHVVAEEPEAFAAWVDHQSQPQPLPTDERIEEGREIFFGSSCVYCHGIEGHGPPNDIGPDLTHLASRETIAGGILPNTRGYLAGWIVDPQALKPGNLMPGTEIAGDELTALLDYLESLE